MVHGLWVDGILVCVFFDFAVVVFCGEGMYKLGYVVCYGNLVC